MCRHDRGSGWGAGRGAGEADVGRDRGGPGVGARPHGGGAAEAQGAFLFLLAAPLQPQNTKSQLGPMMFVQGGGCKAPGLHPPLSVSRLGAWLAFQHMQVMEERCKNRPCAAPITRHLYQRQLCWKLGQLLVCVVDSEHGMAGGLGALRADEGGRERARRGDGVPRQGGPPRGGARGAGDGRRG